MRDVGHYRMTLALAVRLTGGVVVVLALLVMVVGVVAAVAGWPALAVVMTAVGAFTAALAWAAWLWWGADLVRLDDAGYRVRFIRDAGPRSGAWSEVREVAAASPGGVPCLVLHRRDGRDTVVPVALLHADRERFADDVVARVRASDSRGSDAA